MSGQDTGNGGFSLGNVVGGLAFILALANVYQSSSNRSLQAELVEGQKKVANAQALANLNNNLIQLLAKSSVDNGDSAIKNLLARNGVTFGVKDAAGASKLAASSGEEGSKK